tara:strand:+ start:781 stop:1152 length:372 start_codon:yes stop_codon:yes gene_type:complete
MAKKRRNCNRVNPLTRATLEDQGYMVALVEQTIPGTRGIKRDLYGFLDFLAVNQYETLGVQATSLSNKSSRKNKILTERADEAKQWLSFPGRRLEVWGWGWSEKDKSWTLNTTEITLGDFDEP